MARAKTPRSASFENLGALKTSIDGALAAADAARQEACADRAHPTPFPIRRRSLTAQIGLKAKHYGLSDEVQAFVYAAGYRVIQELDNDQLDALNTWLAQWVDGMQAACDSPYTPPAR
ncbi:MAG TPA: hypothetical protein VGF12_09390 [Roseateles sp.]|uniref:hypothetical protein n=1 Tax=Roseateles sp. TaxID=1971397 RepID=UPI002ED7926E